jgi:hypothetical protein
LPKLTDLGKVPCSTSIQNNENGRSYPATSNIIFGKVRKNTANPPDEHHDLQLIGIGTD